MEYPDVDLTQMDQGWILIPPDVTDNILLECDGAQIDTNILENSTVYTTLILVYILLLASH